MHRDELESVGAQGRPQLGPQICHKPERAARHPHFLVAQHQRLLPICIQKKKPKKRRCNSGFLFGTRRSRHDVQMSARPDRVDRRQRELKSEICECEGRPEPSAGRVGNFRDKDSSGWKVSSFSRLRLRRGIASVLGGQIYL